MLHPTEQSLPQMDPKSVVLSYRFTLYAAGEGENLDHQAFRVQCIRGPFFGRFAPFSRATCARSPASGVGLVLVVPAGAVARMAGWLGLGGWRGAAVARGQVASVQTPVRTRCRPPARVMPCVSDASAIEPNRPTGVMTAWLFG